MKITNSEYDQIFALSKAGVNISDIAELTGLPRTTVANVIDRWHVFQDLWKWQPPEYYRRETDEIRVLIGNRQKQGKR